MNILLVDDNNDKIAKIVSVIKNVSSNFNIETVVDSYSAQLKLSNNEYDLILVDLLLPTRFGEEPIAQGGALLLKEISRNSKLITPTFILGITQYDELKDDFSAIWPLLMFNKNEWENSLEEILRHIVRIKERGEQFILNILPSIIVEGETDCLIIQEVIRLFYPEYLGKIKVKHTKSGGASWVANQIVVWAYSLNKRKNGSLVKCIGLLDGDQAGINAIEEINRVVKDDSAGASSFKIFKLSPDYAKETIPLFSKGILLPVTLEETFTVDFWKYADNQGWLEDRLKLDSLLKDPKKWDKRNLSLNDYLNSLNLVEEERIYLKSFKQVNKKDAVKYLLSLDDNKKKVILKNFEKLIKEIIDYLFN
jgi:CheY-like chemotaxis protein